MCKGNGMTKTAAVRIGTFEGAQLGVMLSILAILVWLAPRIPCE